MVDQQLDLGFLLLIGLPNGVSIYPQGKPDTVNKPIVISRDKVISVSIDTVYREGVEQYLEITTLLGNSVGVDPTRPYQLPSTRKQSFLFSKDEVSDLEVLGMVAKVDELFLLNAHKNTPPHSHFGYGSADPWGQQQSGFNTGSNW